MTTCTHLSDRMPATALGRRGWTPEEIRHLERCADCRAEWGVVQVSAQLGAGEDWSVDSTKLARQSLARVAALHARQRRRRRWLVGGLAAAAVLMLMVRLAAHRAESSLPAAQAATLSLPALDSLSEEELRLVLAAVSGPSLEADAELETSGLEALDSTGLEQVLITLEGT